MGRFTKEDLEKFKKDNPEKAFFLNDNQCFQEMAREAGGRLVEKSSNRDYTNSNIMIGGWTTIENQSVKDASSSYMTTDINGSKIWRKNTSKVYHREDGPAIEWFDGTLFWYKDGLFHREDGPAVEWFSGSKEWWKYGKLHREDGPAFEGVGGQNSWWINGQSYTEEEFKSMLFLGVTGSKNGLIEASGGYKRWYKNDKLHREDGPAIEHPNGNKYWYKNDKLHREDGPAIELACGLKYYAISGIEYTEEEFKQMGYKINGFSTREVI